MNIPFFRNTFDEREIEYARRVIERGMYWANGPEIAEFEKRIASYIGTNHCLAFNSGTAALHSILSTCQVKEKEVIVPSFTFIATANSVLMAGGRPVFADIEKETFGLDPEDVKERISKRTCAIMPVHYGGCACRINELREIAEDYKLFLIEDAAESLGAEYCGQKVGSFGDAAMFSFTPTKVISTGEGGVIVTDSKEFYEKMKLFRSHGRLETKDYFSSPEYMDYIAVGYNYRMPTICAAQGIAQLEKIDMFISRRRKIAKIFDDRLCKVGAVRTPEVPENCLHIYQMYSILVQGGRKERDSLQNHLSEAGVTSKVYFEPVHKTSFYNKELGYDIILEQTEELAGESLSLPIYPSLGDEEQRFVIDTIQQHYS